MFTDSSSDILCDIEGNSKYSKYNEIIRINYRLFQLEEDWERELEAELKDYEVVTGNEERNTMATPVRSCDVLDKDWERQIDELLANDDEEGDLEVLSSTARTFVILELDEDEKEYVRRKEERNTR
ncbi:hypothetical protein WN51_13827 [Melipona quadrifasciata]|uniref:Uncharacterized protein n=1 Tax=Melipona quadrifasciata TaxID=166423 RepID=A0A0M9A1A4_9HYME|nr:hypothetical protein WN51_13827 [Melipona quadrifasciata]